MPELLTLENMHAGYGSARILKGISLNLGAGEALAVLGRNGTGKTTLLNTVIGVTTLQSGKLLLNGQDITRLPPNRRAELGIGWVPQERNIFKSLTVQENLMATARPGRFDLAAIYAMFPRLQERGQNLGNQLSGGEQQMLAIGRALLLNPSLLLLDEPTEGLAPMIVEELLATISYLLKNEGLSAIIVEQKADKILQITQQAAVLNRGAIVYASESPSLRANPALLQKLLSVEA